MKTKNMKITEMMEDRVSVLEGALCRILDLLED